MKTNDIKERDLIAAPWPSERHCRVSGGLEGEGLTTEGRGLWEGLVGGVWLLCAWAVLVAAHQ